MHANGERSAFWGVRSMQASQPAEAALGLLILRGFANSAPFTFSLLLIPARRKPMAQFPRVLASDEPIQIPTPFGNSLFRRNNRNQTRWPQPAQRQRSQSSGNFLVRRLRGQRLDDLGATCN